MTETDPRVTEDVKQMLDTDTKYKAVNFVETYTGRTFFPLAPNVNDITIIDIAHHLANQCRYSGAASFYYSTAQHCCLLADFVQKQPGATPLDCLQILIHDAAEAYLVDIPRPIKQHMPQFREWDRSIQMCVRSWLDLGGVPIPPWQDEVDSRIIVDERAQVMSDSGNDWGHNLEPLGIEIAPWSNILAEQQFLMRYAAYSMRVFGKHQYLRSSWGLPTGCVYKEIPVFKTGGSDMPQQGEVQPIMITDLVEVDVRGGVGRVALRSPNGMMTRDTKAGRFPRPAWKWLHGKFEFASPDIQGVNVEIPEVRPQ